jgi:site-specific DNA recombinase
MTTASSSPLRAVIYARLSKEDRDAAGSGVESTALQRRDAAEAVAANGWRCVARPFIDDGISGAEFLKRPALQAMLRDAESAKFDVLVVRDLDRLGREAARVTALLVRLEDAGVRVWSYSDGKFIGLRGADLVLTTVKGIVAEGKRDTDNANIRRALRGRAEAGMATGARRFGYARVPADGAPPNRNGRVPQRWVIDDVQAAVVRRVGEAFVEARGSYRGAALVLNEASVPSASGRTWNHITVRSTLRNPLYRGVLVHGRRRRTHRRGTGISVDAPASEVLRIAHPELAIWPSGLLAKIDALLAQVKPRHTAVTAQSSPATGTPRRLRHLASSLVQCAACGSGLTASGSKKGGKSYVCNRHLQHGRRGCHGIGYRSEPRVDEALTKLATSLVSGDIAARALELVRERLLTLATADGRTSERQRAARDLAEAEHEKTNLARAVAKRGDLDALLSALDEATKRAASLKGKLAQLDAARTEEFDAKRALARIEARLGELARGVDTRAVLAAALQGNRFVATPVHVDGERRWALRATVSAGYLVALTSTPSSGSDPSGSCPSCAAPFGSRASFRRPRPSWRPSSFQP